MRRPRGAPQLVPGLAAPQWRRVRRRLREAFLDKRAQRLEEDLPLPGGEAFEDVVLDLVDELLALSDRALTGAGHGDHPRSAIRAGGLALCEALLLELVHRHDHRGLVEPDLLSELLLGELAGSRRGEDVVAAIRHPERLECGGDLADQVEVRLGEKPSQIAGEAVRTVHGDCGLPLALLGGRGYGHRHYRSTVGSKKNYLLRTYFFASSAASTASRSATTSPSNRTAASSSNGVGPLVITAMLPPRPSVTEGSPATG